MPSRKFQPVHVIHLLLFSPTINEKKPVPIFGRTRLMKMMFIFEKEIANKFSKNQVVDFMFEPFTYGPFSKKVCEAIDFLSARDLIKITSEQKNYSDERQDDANLDRLVYSFDEDSASLIDGLSYLNEEYSLTSDGIKMMEDESMSKWFSWCKLTANQKEILIRFKTNMINTSLRDILKYVYSKYPKYAEKSVIKNELLTRST